MNPVLKARVTSAEKMQIVNISGYISTSVPWQKYGQQNYKTLKYIVMLLVMIKQKGAN